MSDKEKDFLFFRFESILNSAYLNSGNKIREDI